MVRIRQMTAGDIGLGLQLRAQAGWNQTEADWRRFLSLAPDGCFVAELDRHPVATTTTCLHGGVGWIAMVLVDQAARHRGIGTRLVEHAVHHLMTRGARTVRLDATAQGRPVYERLGFVADFDLARMRGTAHAPGHPHRDISPMSPGDLAAIGRLDQSVTGSDRSAFISSLFADAPGCGVKLIRDGGISGYAMWRAGCDATTIGPAIALDPIDGAPLMDWVLAACGGLPVFVDIPIDNHPSMDWAHSRGLDVQRRFTRMHLGLDVAERTDRMWASSGPEKG